MNSAQDPDRLNADGLALVSAGRPHDGERRYRAAIALAPSFMPALGNLANLDAEAGRLVLACGRYLRALAISPLVAGLHLMLGTARLRLSQDDLGERSLARALELNPGYPKAYANLGIHALERHRPADAENHLRNALRGDPTYAPALAGLARALCELGRMEGVATLSRKSAALDPRARESLLAVAEATFATGRLDIARRWHLRALAVDSRPEALRPLMLFLHYDPLATSREIYEIHRRWGASREAVRPSAPPTRDARPDRRLRVAYMSADLFDHPIGRCIVGPLEQHDPAEVEIFAYAEKSEDDAVNRRIRTAAHHWRSTAGRSDDAVARMLAEDAIDILVTLAGHTYPNRIGVVPLASVPLKISMYDLTTSGLESMDWLISDPVLTPPGIEEGFCERLYRIPCCYVHSPIDPVPIVDRAGPLVFGSCNNPVKLNDRVVAIWSRILERLPSATLHLKYRRSFADPELKRDLQRRFASHGIAASRIGFEGGQTDRKGHLRYIGGLDITLDTFPFNGSTSTYESLWMGVPVVTLLGKRFVGRMGATTLRHVGLEDLVAKDEADYIEIAVRLADDHERRQALRRQLRDRLAASKFLDPAAYARSIEEAYRLMWREWCARPGNPNR